MLHLTWRAGRWPLAITFMAAALAACSDTPTATRPLNGRLAPSEVQPASVADVALVYFMIDYTAVIDRESGNVRVTGMVGCSTPATFDVGVELLVAQKRGGTTVHGSSTLPKVECTTAWQPWTATFEGGKGLRHNGSASVNVYTGAQVTPIVPTELNGPVTLVRESR